MENSLMSEENSVKAFDIQMQSEQIDLVQEVRKTRNLVIVTAIASNLILAVYLTFLFLN